MAEVEAKEVAVCRAGGGAAAAAAAAGSGVGVGGGRALTCRKAIRNGIIHAL